MVESYCLIDFFKLLMSIFVIIIHSQIATKVAYPWVRVAVPFFFIASSFIFFKRIKCMQYEIKKRYLLLMIKRNLKLYFIWFIILLPFTISNRIDWFSSGPLIGLIKFFRGLFLSSTFRASWFIMALVIAISIVFFFIKYFKMKTLVCGSVFIYCLCCISSNQIIFTNSIINNMFVSLNIIFDGMQSSFLVALIWVLIGYLFAENKILLSKKAAIIGGLLSACFLFLEYYVATNMFNLYPYADCYLALIPISVFLFSYILSFGNINIKYAREMRKCSTFMYVSHCAIISISNIILRHVGLYTKENAFILTIIILSFMCFVLLKLSKCGKYKFINELW